MAEPAFLSLEAIGEEELGEVEIWLTGQGQHRALFIPIYKKYPSSLYLVSPSLTVRLRCAVFTAARLSVELIHMCLVPG